MPLRNNSRIAQPGGSTASGSAGKTAGGITAMKFDNTNEPDGVYAHAVWHDYHPATGALIKVQECVANATNTECNLSVGQVYWEAKAVDAVGNLTLVKLGNGLSTFRDIDRSSGTLHGIQTGASNTDGTLADMSVQQLAFTWDVAGNLTQRQDLSFNNGANGGFEETFVYDGLDRLIKTETNYHLTAGSAAIERHTFYDDSGNIACFNQLSASCGTASYSYDAQHPHAVAGVSGSAYSYDANGSMISGPGGRAITWTAFNKPSRIEAQSGALFAEFRYDPNRARYQQLTQAAITTYVGSLYERVEEGGTTTHRFHIFAGGSAVAVYSCTTQCGEDPQGNAADGTRDETLYLHRDHLGSITVITDGHGVEQERFTYMAWGSQQRWNPAANGGVGDFEPASSDTQTRGYTGHEMLSELGLIHMNGRIYDQNIGRFISADPFVQFPHSTQGYNRYAYVNNNPLSYTDPSGYFLDDLKDLVKTAISVVAMVYLGPVVGGAIAGYLATGDFQGVVFGIIGGGMSFGLGEAFVGANGAALTGGQLLAKSLLHGISQGALSAAGGGRFGDGFLGGFVGSYAGGKVKALGGKSLAGKIQRTVAAAVAGGTAARLGGGKFANGAITAAFVQVFNHEMHFDGKSLKHYDDDGNLIAEYPATSGVEGNHDQSEPWKGPIPEGEYTLNPEEISKAGIGRKLLNAMGTDWGEYRVPLHPNYATQTYGRDGFFVHGGNRLECPLYFGRSSSSE